MDIIAQRILLQMNSFPQQWKSLPPAEEAEENPAQQFHTASAGMLPENWSSPKEKHLRGGGLRNQTEKAGVFFLSFAAKC